MIFLFSELTKMLKMFYWAWGGGAAVGIIFVAAITVGVVRGEGGKGRGDISPLYRPP